MKPFLSMILVLALATGVVAQESEKTTITTTTTTVSNSWDLYNNWSVDDASVVPCGRVDLRIKYNWVTASFPANAGDSDDDSIFTPAIFWGAAENLQISVTVPVWVGDQGNIAGGQDGNADTYLGVVWRFREQDGYVPAMALSSTLRIPTGDESAGMDLEARLILTNEYDSCIRSHFNAFATTVNGNNSLTDRHFQWGFVFGLDGPINDEVRWVVDYMNRSSYNRGSGNINLLDLGFEWQMDECNALSMSVQVGLDDNDDTPNAGVGLLYAHSFGG